MDWEKYYSNYYSCKCVNISFFQTVVSGQVEPDHIYIKRDVQNNLKISKIEVGSKSHKMCINPSEIGDNSNIKTIDLDTGSKKVSLSEDECLRLGKIAVGQETLWGSPRDIEWAISDVILQFYWIETK
jgi:phosphoenolpyruvate synthase/pyruvate phosphate dikinase